MSKINLFTEYEKDTEEEVEITKFRERVLELFDLMLNSGRITEVTEAQKLAHLRAKIVIELKEF